jgi:hypothetical protein
MTGLQKGLIVAALHCAIGLSLTGKLMYDRATRPRIWVQAMSWDPSLPIRGRYLSLRLKPDAGAAYFSETNDQRVLFFVPEHPTALERGAGSLRPDIWAEVTIPRKGPPRPIRLGIKSDGQIRPVVIN